jgi:ABC-2 type transport system ATP-binding protein
MQIEAKNVFKSFKNVQAVRGISTGEFVAFLGPNDAGKTTLVEMMEGLQQPNSGEIFIDGKTGKMKSFGQIFKIPILSTTAGADKIIIFIFKKDIK